MSDDDSSRPGNQGMPAKTLVLMLVAVGCGLVAAFLASHLTNEPRRSDPAGMMRVIVARKDISPGTMVQDPAEFFKVVFYRHGDEPKGSFRDLANLKDKVVVKGLTEDQPVTEKDLNPQ
jgi:flagella basal body P-ring formation protein FlgA